MFEIPCDMVFPCSHRNEIDGEFAEMTIVARTCTRLGTSAYVGQLGIAFVLFTSADDA